MKFPASLTTAWYLKPSGACPNELSAIVVIATNANNILFILLCFDKFKCFEISCMLIQNY